MRFAVDADAYDRFMGRYSVRLAPAFADFAQVPRASVSRADDRRNDEGDRRAGGLARETLVSPEERRRRRISSAIARAASPNKSVAKNTSDHNRLRSPLGRPEF